MGMNFTSKSKLSIRLRVSAFSVFILTAFSPSILDSAEQEDVSLLLSEVMAELGMVFINKTLSQKFLPQMLDLHVHGAVDFDKGCYLGQEIVARAQFRGAVKKQHAHFQWDGQAPAIGETWQDPTGVKGDVLYVGAAPTAQETSSDNASGCGLWVTRKTENDAD